MMDLVKGVAAPAFVLAAEDGRTLTLADYAGHKLALYFYPKDDTSGCTKEAQAFCEHAAAFAAAGTRVLGVSKDSIASHAKFRAKYDLTIDLGADPEGAAVEAYGAWIEKSMYGKKYMGIDRSTFLIGRDGKIADIWRKVKVPGHAEAVLAAAQALG
jgi:peroxiredoxin Q/BCP